MSSVGQDINAKDGLWSFGNKVPRNFDGHVMNQVPYYLDGHNLILDLLPFFLRKNSKVLDIGCSTGTLLNDFSSKYPKKNYKQPY